MTLRNEVEEILKSLSFLGFIALTQKLKNHWPSPKRAEFDVPSFSADGSLTATGTLSFRDSAPRDFEGMAAMSLFRRTQRPLGYSEERRQSALLGAGDLSPNIRRIYCAYVSHSQEDDSEC